jgi:hypothetical protein
MVAMMAAAWPRWYSQINSLMNPQADRSTVSLVDRDSEEKGFKKAPRDESVTLFKPDEEAAAAAVTPPSSGANSHCTPYVTGGGKSCQGDSGGPIVNAYGEQVGVVSWGTIDWIETNACALSSALLYLFTDICGTVAPAPALAATPALARLRLSLVLETMKLS